MASMTLWKYQGREVRTVLGGDGEPRFVAADVCRVLDLKGDPGQHTRTLDDDEKGLITTQTLGGPQEIAVVTESGVYSLIFRSRKPEAKAFRRWVTHEVLPQIRRIGAYAVPETLGTQIGNGLKAALRGIGVAACREIERPTAAELSRARGITEQAMRRAIQYPYGPLDTIPISKLPEIDTWIRTRLAETMGRYGALSSDSEESEQRTMRKILGAPPKPTAPTPPPQKRVWPRPRISLREQDRVNAELAHEVDLATKLDKNRN